MGQLYYYDSGSSSWLPTQVGAQGPQGYQGSVGAQGFQGSVGAQGTQGFQGSVGAQGNQGFQGSVGAQGAANLPASATASVSVTATAGQVTTCNPSSTFAVTLPASPANGTICGVYVLAAATSYVTVAAGSGNTLDYAVGRLYAGQSAYLVYNSTTTSWVSPTQNNQQANPTGRIYSAAGTSLTGSANTTITLGTSSALTGGMTRSGNTLVVPITGYYQVNAIVNAGSAQNLWTTVQAAGSTASYTSENGSGYVHQINDVIYATAGQGISINCYNWGATFTTVNLNNLSAALVSQ